MKKQSVYTLLFLFLGSIYLIGCSKSNTPAPTKNPSNPKEITLTLADVSAQYFILQKSSGVPLVLVYFVQEAGGLKFYYDGRTTRRSNTPTLTNLDTKAGTATLNLDLNGDGTSVLSYQLKKSVSGILSLEQTDFGTTSPYITSSKMYSVADLVGFQFNGSYMSRNMVDASTGSIYKETYEFTSSQVLFSSLSFNPGFPSKPNWSQVYYALPNNVGAKADPRLMVAVFKKSSAIIGYLVDDNGIIKEF